MKGTEAANLINCYFANVGENLAMQVADSEREFWPNQTDSVFDWGYRITEPNVLYNLDSFSLGMSFGIKDLSSRILLDYFKVKPDVMANLSNKCLDSGKHPCK